jgi:hypothetical protein
VAAVFNHLVAAVARRFWFIPVDFLADTRHETQDRRHEDACPPYGRKNRLADWLINGSANADWPVAFAVCGYLRFAFFFLLAGFLRLGGFGAADDRRSCSSFMLSIKRRQFRKTCFGVRCFIGNWFY